MGSSLKQVRLEALKSVLWVVFISLVMELGFIALSGLTSILMTLTDVAFDYFGEELNSIEHYKSRFKFIFVVWVAPSTLYTLFFMVKSLYQEAITYSYSKAIALGEYENPLLGKKRDR